MLLFLNIVLSIFGSVFALATFFGETWVKGDNPLKKKITPIGRISLICLLITVGVGLWKEVESSKATADADAKAEQAQKLIDQKLDKVNTELKQTAGQFLNGLVQLNQTISSEIDRLKSSSDASFHDGFKRLEKNIIGITDYLKQMSGSLTKSVKTIEQTSETEIEELIRNSQEFQKITESFKQQLQELEEGLESENSPVSSETIQDKTNDIQVEHPKNGNNDIQGKPNSGRMPVPGGFKVNKVN